MSKTQSGTLLIADITGYTFFLSESELEHAQEILETLLEILIKETRPRSSFRAPPATPSLVTPSVTWKFRGKRSLNCWNTSTSSSARRSS